MAKAKPNSAKSTAERLPTHVYRRKENGGRLSVEVTVPVALQEIVGSKRFKHSLKVTALDTQKRQEAAIKAGEFLARIEEAKRKLSERDAVKAAQDAKEDARRNLISLGIFDGAPITGGSRDEPWDIPTPKASPLADILDSVASGWPTKEASDEQLEEAVSRMTSAGSDLDRLTLQLEAENYIKVESARLEAGKRALERLRKPLSPAVTVALEKTLTITQWLEDYLKDQQKTKDTERQYRNAVDLYRSSQEDKPIAEVTHADADAYLRYLHSRTDLAHGTCDQRLKKLRALFSYALTRRKIAFNPFTGLTVSENAKAGHGNEIDRTYYPPETFNITLTEILPTFEPSDSLRWPYLLCFFTGARIEEVCGLRLDEVGKHWDVNCLHFRPRPEDNRTIKTGEKRYTPIHEFLWGDLGFGNFVAARQASHQTMLFDFNRWRGKFYSGKFSEAMKDLRAPIEQQRGADLGDQHALRHNLDNLLSAAGVHEEYRCLILGQATGSRTNAGYGTRDATLEHLRDALHKIDLRRFDFTKLIA